MAVVTPPLDAFLFFIKGVAPLDATMGDIYKSVTPYLVCDAVVMALIILLPPLALWLPGLAI
jgi:TRAP-type mannitol/chloroaromatic compound transport system permease large subunit